MFKSLRSLIQSSKETCDNSTQVKVRSLVAMAEALMVANAEEIMPEAHQTQDTNWSMLTFIRTFAVSMLFSVYLE
ncbi:hypothetical protein [Calothrix sp. UHCC 0171]|uniref:hypothetical protein n=1 Tax=Calothrix sp. UHCC 0171 TaxID=3110245 RepID=UPI002B1E944C|nr:hypothetical protein [Calothrix sp. UHCC 0171]MEA5573665.1 hypothetical protein [Calothrix sp. UHCC 0171]